MDKWEYRTVEIGSWDDVEDQLDQLGADGWELVTSAVSETWSQPPPNDFVAQAPGRWVRDYRLILKRPQTPEGRPKAARARGTGRGY